MRKEGVLSWFLLGCRKLPHLSHIGTAGLSSTNNTHQHQLHSCLMACQEEKKQSDVCHVSVVSTLDAKAEVKPGIECSFHNSGED